MAKKTTDSKSLSQLRRLLRSHATQKRAMSSARYFKTGPGEYGEGDLFLGVTVPQTRLVAKQGGALTLVDLGILISSPLHEERLLALMILVDRAKRGSLTERRTLLRFYIKNRKKVNNWDLIDSSAEYILGPFLLTPKKADYALWKRLSRSSSQWDRRIAILSTFYLIKLGRFNETLQLARQMLNDAQPLIHKASGWMLREIGNRDKKVLVSFLDRYGPAMPRTMLRYSIEKFSPKERLWYLTR